MKVKEWKKVILADSNYMTDEVAKLISDKIESNTHTKIAGRDKEGRFIMTKEFLRKA